MANTAVSEVPTSLPDPVEPVSEAARRDRVYRAVADHVSTLTATYVEAAMERYRERLATVEEGQTVLPPSEKLPVEIGLGKELLAGITEIIFTAALRDGYFRFPDGFGSFRVQRLTEKPKPKRLPTGQLIAMPPNRVKFKYEDGAAVREALGLSRKTNYVRRYTRQSRLTERTTELLTRREE
jgi:hypothetical protein